MFTVERDRGKFTEIAEVMTGNRILFKLFQILSIWDFGFSNPRVMLNVNYLTFLWLPAFQYDVDIDSIFGIFWWKTFFMINIKNISFLGMH